MANENPAGAEQKKAQGQAGGEQRAAKAGETPKQLGMERAGEQRTGGGLSRREARAPMLRGSDLFTMSPFSLMRRMMDDFDRMFEDAGFAIRKFDEQRFPRIPIRRGSLAPQFAGRSDEDLSVLGFHIVASA